MLNGDYEYRFNGPLSYNDQKHYSEKTGLFCLWDNTKNREVIVIELWDDVGSNVSALKGYESARLEIFHIPFVEYRNRGVANFYMKRITEYIISLGMKELCIHPNPSDALFKSTITHHDMDSNSLKQFYSKFKSPDLSIKFI